VSLLWVILALAIAALVGAKAWSDAKKRSREAAVAAEQKRQTSATINREREEFEAKVAAEKSKSEYAKASDALAAAQARWKDALRVADATSRVSLSGPVSNLQTIRRETEALMLPECLGAARKKLAEGMQVQIDGFLTFMANTGEMGKILAGGKLEDGAKLVQDAQAEAERCQPAT
jgi:prophage DNA circulation protein